jgi:hypothetical protein
MPSLSSRSVGGRVLTFVLVVVLFAVSASSLPGHADHAPAPTAAAVSCGFHGNPFGANSSGPDVAQVQRWLNALSPDQGGPSAASAALQVRSTRSSVPRPPLPCAPVSSARR